MMTETTMPPGLTVSCQPTHTPAPLPVTGDGRGRGLACAGILAPRGWSRRPLDRDDARGPRAGRPEPAGMPRELLRGRCVRALGRQHIFERGRVGSRGARQRTDAAFGVVWQWTRSAYLPDPGYRPVDGALGESGCAASMSSSVL